MFFEDVSDGAGAATTIRDYQIFVKPSSMYPLYAVSNRLGLLVITTGHLPICDQGNYGSSYTNVKIGSSDATELHGSYCFTHWKTVADTGNKIVTLLERLPDGTIVYPT
jgi:hypothetical protein